MAIYEFLCSECSHQDDLIRKMNDSSVIICPKCKKNTFAKQVSAPNFQLSGSGWYATDFKNKPSIKQAGNKELKKTTNSEAIKNND
jgi:putative FmdB family regulatory protein